MKILPPISLRARLIERRGNVFVVIGHSLSEVLAQLRRGNWALFFSAEEQGAVATQAAESSIDLNALPALVKQIGADVGVISRPDDTEWLVAAPD
jgi:hypothetical protein